MARTQRIVEKRGANHGLHVFLSIITCGLWAITGWPIAAAMGRKTVTRVPVAPPQQYPPQPYPPAQQPYAQPPQQYGPPPGPYGQQPPPVPYDQQQTRPHGTSWGQP